MAKIISPVLSLIAIVLVLVIWLAQATTELKEPLAETGTNSHVETYSPRLELDPPVPQPPDDAVRDFAEFLNRLRLASQNSPDSLVFHRESLERAEDVFRSTVAVPKDVRLELHSPFYTVNPESIFALFSDIPTLERGLGLFQQHCSQCHGPYGRGNGASTLQWYSGNFPRNFWYGKFKNRSTEYGTMPTDEDLYRTLTRGLYGSSMPSFRHLSVQDRWSLVQLVKTMANFYDDYEPAVVNRFDPQDDFVGTPVDVSDEPKLDIESVTRGRVLFIEHGCVSCHQGSQARPVGLSRWEGQFLNWTDEMQRPIQHSRDLTTSVYLAGAASSDLFRIITGGPNVGPMPSYATMPSKDRWSLVHYMQSVFKPDLPQAPVSADKTARKPEAINAQ